METRGPEGDLEAAVRTSGAGDKIEDGTDADTLYGQIGRLQVQVEWLKKVRTEPTAVRWGWIEPHHPALSLADSVSCSG